MIKIDNLVKAFGPKRAVDGISFTVERGEVLGFLGPNGAGKSTSMRMITGFIPPTSGTATVGGFDIVEQGIEARPSTVDEAFRLGFARLANEQLDRAHWRPRS